MSHRKSLWIFSVLAIAAAPVAAAVLPFTAGDLVVTRIGTGSGALGSAATAEFLDEYTASGTLVQSVALPTAANGANQPFTNSGSATSEGALSRSADGQYLILAGYGATPGATGIANTTSAAVPRVIARVDSSGNIDTTTALTDAYGGNNIRSATSDDGSAFWAGGATGGVRYATLGSTTSTVIAATPANNRIVNIIGGQLYISTGSAPIGVYSVGTGLPATSGQSSSILPGTTLTGGSPYDYVLADANTLYVADDRTSGSGGLEKFTLAGGTWSLAYSSIVGTAGLRSLTISGSTLYGITTDNKLVSAIDTGSGFSFNTIASGTTTTAFRGVDLAPVAIPEPGTMSIAIIGVISTLARRRRA